MALNVNVIRMSVFSFIILTWVDKKWGWVALNVSPCLFTLGMTLGGQPSPVCNQDVSVFSFKEIQG